MKRDWTWLAVLAALLLLGMLLTLFWGGAGSRHGYGAVPWPAGGGPQGAPSRIG